MADAKTYLRIIDEKRSEVEKKALQLKKEKDKAEAATSEKKTTGAPEVKINPAYFEKTGRSIAETYGSRDDEPEQPKVTAEVSVNQDAAYFKWKKEKSKEDSDTESVSDSDTHEEEEYKNPRIRRRFWSDD